ncbi:hypothetical protein L2E82_51673 [Cichorium intybus]|nr:hypothetical protein L2E82_51673 [Cichorium intybus]
MSASRLHFFWNSIDVQNSTITEATPPSKVRLEFRHADETIKEAIWSSDTLMKQSKKQSPGSAMEDCNESEQIHYVQTHWTSLWPCHLLLVLPPLHGYERKMENHFLKRQLRHYNKNMKRMWILIMFPNTAATE